LITETYLFLIIDGKQYLVVRWKNLTVYFVFG
jgi:hypothetical protein